MKKVSTEQMRYSVPGVKNRFWQVHGRLIALCAILCLLAVTVSLSFATVRQAYTLEPKNTLIYYGTVQNEEEARQLVLKYYDRVHIVLFMYETNARKSQIVETCGQKAGYYNSKNRQSTGDYYLAALFERNSAADHVYTAPRTETELSTAQLEKLVQRMLGEL